MGLTRRDFLKTGVAAGVVSGLGIAQTTRRSATDWVTLGKSNVKVTRLAFGTGTHGGRVQRELGQEEFTRLVRHAYDRGIRFFETAESYHGMPEMLSIALKGIPRDSYKLMTKYSTRLRAIPRRRSTSSGSSWTPSTSTFCCCIACVRPPGPPITAACRTDSRKRSTRRSFWRRARRFTDCRRCERSQATSGWRSP